MRKQELLNVEISTGAYNEFVGHLLELAQVKESKYTCVANVHMLMEGYNDPLFANVVNNADVITPDGKPLTWALRLLYGVKQDRVAGMDLLPDLLQQAVDKNVSVYFYGGSEELLNDTREYIAGNYPNLKIAGFYSPPFRDLTPEEENMVVRQINQSGAEFVFVVLGCPKQEKWMATMKGKINSVMIGIGGALSVMIGRQKRAPRWMQHYGLEWFFRLMQEPKRLFKRYAVTNTQFVFLLIREYLRIKVLRRVL